MKGGAYISLARNYSFLILLAMYLTLDGTIAFLHKLRLLDDARRTFATLVADSNPFSPTDTNLVKELDIAGETTVEIRRLSPDLRLADSVRVNSVQGSWEKFGLGLNGQPDRGFFIFSQRTEAFNSVSARRRLAEIYAEQWHGEAPTNYISSFKTIEYGIFQKQVKVPVIDLEFASHRAPWVLSLLIVGIVLQIRHNARRTLLDPDLAIEEPWLLLDGRRGLERAVAIGWLLGVTLAPWISNGCVLAAYASQIDKSNSESLARELAVLSAGLVLFIIGGWTSLTTLAELLRLRRLRLARAQALVANEGTEVLRRESD